MQIFNIEQLLNVTEQKKSSNLLDSVIIVLTFEIGTHLHR